MSLAETAIRWIVRAVKLVRRNRHMVKGITKALVTSEKLQNRLEKMFGKLEWLENKYDAHMDTWGDLDKAQRAVKSGGSVQLVINGESQDWSQNVGYLHTFKSKVFDRYLKPIGTKMLGKGVEEITATEDVDQPPPVEED